MRSGWFVSGLLLALTACTGTSHPTLRHEVAGVVNNDLTLFGEVLLTGDLLVLPGRTLTLQPGTTVRVRRAESTKIDPEYLSSFTEILIRGRLVAAGTADEPIVFLPERELKSGEVGWAGIILDQAGRSTLAYARIEGAEQGVLAIAGSPSLTKNTIFNCRYGIVAQSTEGAAIYSNHIEAGEGGIFLLAGADGEIAGNRITGQIEEGLFVDAGSSPHLGRNEISGNGLGLVLHNPELPFEEGGISHNREDLRLIGRE